MNSCDWSHPSVFSSRNTGEKKVLQEYRKTMYTALYVYLFAFFPRRTCFYQKHSLFLPSYPLPPSLKAPDKGRGPLPLKKEKRTTSTCRMVLIRTNKTTQHKPTAAIYSKSLYHYSTFISYYIQNITLQCSASETRGREKKKKKKTIATTVPLHHEPPPPRPPSLLNCIILYYTILLQNNKCKIQTNGLARSRTPI